MKTKSILFRLASAALLTISIGIKAEASYIANIYQSGGNVVTSGSGYIDTAALSASVTAQSFPLMDPANGSVNLGADGLVDIRDYTGATGAADFGSGGYSFPSSGTGDFIGIYGTSGAIYLPAGYVSGSALSATDTYDSTTLADLGLTPGTYVYNWGSGLNADSFTVDVQAPAPEPGTVCLFGVGVLGLALNCMRLGKRIVHS
jgi:hypothetical protein